MTRRGRTDLGALLELVGEIYQAALEPQRWPVALERSRQAIGGAAIWSGVAHYRENRVLRDDTIGLDRERLAELYRRYLRNPLTDAGAQILDGRVVRTSEMVPLSELGAEFLNEVILPLEVVWGVGSNVSLDPGSVSVFCVYRPMRQGDYDDQEVATCQLLAPHTPNPPPKRI